MGAGSSLLSSCPAARPRRRFGNRCLTSIVAAGLLLAACGDDEGDAAREAAPHDTAPTMTEPATDPAPPAAAPEGEGTTAAPPASERTGPESPEDRPGGAGDEVPASSHALFTGRAGTIRPRRVQVPPFIAIRAELRSSDGRRYSLRFGRRSIAAGGDIDTASTTFDGLRPGRRLVGIGRAGRVVIEASAEPGP